MSEFREANILFGFQSLGSCGWEKESERAAPSTSPSTSPFARCLLVLVFVFVLPLDPEQPTPPPKWPPPSPAWGRSQPLLCICHSPILQLSRVFRRANWPERLRGKARRQRQRQSAESLSPFLAAPAVPRQCHPLCSPRHPMRCDAMRYARSLRVDGSSAPTSEVSDLASLPPRREREV